MSARPGRSTECAPRLGSGRRPIPLHGAPPFALRTAERVSPCSDRPLRLRVASGRGALRPRWARLASGQGSLISKPARRPALHKTAKRERERARKSEKERERAGGRKLGSSRDLGHAHHHALHGRVQVAPRTPRRPSRPVLRQESARGGGGVCVGGGAKVGAMSLLWCDTPRLPAVG